VEFGAPADDGTRELRVFSLYGFSSGAASMRYVSVMPITPSPAELAAYEGTYSSDELGVVFTVVLQGERLVLHRPKQADGWLQATSADTFSVDEDRFSLGFGRDSTGTIVGFEICSDRVRRLQFTRVRRREP
jgi:hypothetical protein